MADSGLTPPWILLPKYGRFLTESGSRWVVQKYLSDGLLEYPNSAEFIDLCCFLVRHKCAIFAFLKRKKAYVTRKPLIYLVVMGGLENYLYLIV